MVTVGGVTRCVCVWCVSPLTTPALLEPSSRCCGPRCKCEHGMLQYEALPGDPWWIRSGDVQARGTRGLLRGERPRFRLSFVRVCLIGRRVCSPLHPPAASTAPCRRACMSAASARIRARATWSPCSASLAGINAAVLLSPCSRHLTPSRTTRTASAK